MSKKIYYRYNPGTDNFERVYPSLKSRFASWGRMAVYAVLWGTALFLLVFYCFDSPTQENLRTENAQLRTQYAILNKRMENSMRVLDRIRDRDDNFYRVIMQMDPMSENQRLAGLDDEKRYRQLQRLSDASLVRRLTQNMDLIERQIYAQLQSFDQLRGAVGQQKEKLAHIPSVLPVSMNDYTLSSGYGYRRDPIYGSMKFHEGLDFSAPTGTQVFATADGKVSFAGRKPGYGNCIEIDHGFNYLTRFAHLSKVEVKEGTRVTRGQLIGRVGSTGKSTGPHLHYEVRFKDEAQNPVHYYFMDLDPEQYAEMIMKADNAGHVMD